MPQIYGHAKIRRALRADLAGKNLAPAYLFTGPSKVGKFSLAKKFAAEIQAPGRSDADRARRRKILKIRDPETVVVDKIWIAGIREDFDKIARKTNLDQAPRKAAGVRTDALGVEDVRALEARLRRRPLGDFLLAVIRRADRLTPAAQNALLKILEEPPPGVHFFLTATDPARLLPTVVSRCRVVKFRAPGEKISLRALEKLFPKIPEETRKTALRLAAGRIGRAVELVRKPLLAEDYAAEIRDLERLFSASRAEKFRAAKKFAESRRASARALRLLTVLAAERLRAGAPGAENLAAELVAARDRLRGPANARLVWEGIFLEMA